MSDFNGMDSNQDVKLEAGVNSFISHFVQECILPCKGTNKITEQK